MAELLEYSSYIIDLTNAMLDHRRGLNDAQLQRVQMINSRAVDFITSYLMNENASAESLLNYLNHDAQSPLRIILGCAQTMISGNCGALQEDYNDAVQEIYDCVFAIIDEIQQVRMDLQHFMESIGIEN